MSLIEWKISTIENSSRQRQVNVIRYEIHPRYNERIAMTTLHRHTHSSSFPRNKIIDRAIHSSSLLLRKEKKYWLLTLYLSKRKKNPLEIFLNRFNINSK